MDIKIFGRRMIELLPRFSRELAQRESNYLSYGKITSPQLWALEYLSKKKGCLMCEIADYLGVSRPAVTGLVDRLIHQKLAKRENVPHDRREIKVCVTPKGKNLVVDILTQRRRTFEKMFSRISPHERKVYLTILERVIDEIR